ncbi:bifunctional 5,10-methylenetetrahydrofolate dehydrogenase/5,10-methenyltetrahydrofolate cyclohydrolase [Amycolatopsis sp. NPDC059021]|uniref:bifunctional 5,10-methylenetetrahydrofolate dehydrogenase/5,10-methenyltetrahydrofolate cyclohydrolase n=1 Tax=Amycolatopsis sp. NPDC059021 TaxID=3346704 RepID=UPI0036703294
MTAISLSGKELAASIRARVKETADALTAAGTPPKLAVVVATDDGSSLWYVRSIAKAAAKSGIECDVVDLGADTTAEEIRRTLGTLSADDTVHGIILQTPLPEGATAADLAGTIDPAKDVDGANPASLGRLAARLPAFAPATAEAVMALLDHHDVPLAGRHAVVIGRSTVVGVPAAQLLLARDATVSVCHSRTADLPGMTRQADVLVVAVGRAGMVTAGHVAPGTVVIDVGTNPAEDGGLAGDVAAEVSEVAGALTPVPGGVGPVTTALLLGHTVDAASLLSQR